MGQILIASCLLFVFLGLLQCAGLTWHKLLFEAEEVGAQKDSVDKGETRNELDTSTTTSAGSSWLSAIGHINYHQRQVRQEASRDVSASCSNVEQCLTTSHFGDFRDVFVRFELGELFAASEKWCKNSPMEACWRNQCRDVTLEAEMVFIDRVITRICQRRNALKDAASSCCLHATPLGPMLEECLLSQGHRRVEPKGGQGDARVTDLDLARRYRVVDPKGGQEDARVTDLDVLYGVLRCGHGVFDSLPESCRYQDKNFLKGFYDFIVSELRSGSVNIRQ